MCQYPACSSRIRSANPGPDGASAMLYSRSNFDCRIRGTWEFVVKVVCLQEQLQRALSLVSRAVASKTALPVLGNVLLSAEDIVRLRKAAQASQNPHLGFIVSLLLLTKLRVREMLAAQWEDIDLANGIWRVASGSGQGVVDLPLTGAAIEIIRQLPRWDDCPHVIANPRTKKALWFHFPELGRSQAAGWDAPCEPS